MRLPFGVVRVRSKVAHGIGRGMALFEPLFLRLRRFRHECRARGLLRGEVAPGVQFVGPIISEGTGHVNIGPRTRVGRRVFFETYGEGHIDIGERVTLNDGIVICAYDAVAIGDHTMIGEYTSIRDANHGTRKGTFVRDQPHTAAAVRIGRDVWVGRGVMIAAGVRIGDGAVVGANSVVTRDVAANCIVAGAPARAIGERKGPPQTRA